LPARISGQTVKGLNICGGIMWRLSLALAIPVAGKTREFTKEDGSGTGKP